MEYKITGTRKITDDLTLKDFSFDVTDIHYNRKSRYLSIDVKMIEKLFPHMRSFGFNLPEEYGSFEEQAAIDYIMTLPPFIGAKKI